MHLFFPTIVLVVCFCIAALIKIYYMMIWLVFGHWCRVWSNWKGGKAWLLLFLVTCGAGMLLKKLIFWYADTFVRKWHFKSLTRQSQLCLNNLTCNYEQVSELLGSFGDNELSPECLDGAQRFLKPDGISIPSSYWPFSLFALLLYNWTSLHSFDPRYPHISYYLIVFICSAAVTQALSNQ